MKKILLAVIATLTLSATAQAKEISQHINLGVNQSTVDSQSGEGFDVTWGVTRVWEGGIMTTFDLNYGQVTIENEDFNNYGGDLKIGYKYKDIALYGIGSAIEGSYHNLKSAGFGYGAGAEYTPFEHLGVGIDYKKYSMTSQINEYDFEVAKAYLKIIF